MKHFSTTWTACLWIRFNSLTSRPRIILARLSIEVKLFTSDLVRFKLATLVGNTFLLPWATDVYNNILTTVCVCWCVYVCTFVTISLKKIMLCLSFYLDYALDIWNDKCNSFDIFYSDISFSQAKFLWWNIGQV